MQIKEKFIAFIDILGFKQMVESSENGTGMPLDEIIEITKILGITKKYSVCMHSPYIQRDLDFKIYQVSDCVIISSEISPSSIVNLAYQCNGVAYNLLLKGIMCRGYITQGKICHEDNIIIGSGYHKAIEQEKNVCAFIREADERGTPYIEVDNIVCDYVSEFGDNCVKKMFSRVIKSDGIITALFPFQSLGNSFTIGGYGNKFDPDKIKQSNNNVRQLIMSIKERLFIIIDNKDHKVVQKANHYINALDSQLIACDEQDRMIDMLCAPIKLKKLSDYINDI